jgi:hypothetical protein
VYGYRYVPALPGNSASGKALWGKLKKQSMADVVLAVRAADKWKAKVSRIGGGEGEEGLCRLNQVDP